MTSSTTAHGGVDARTAAFRAAYRAQIAALYNGVGACLADLSHWWSGAVVLHPADPPTDLGRMVDRAGHCRGREHLRMVFPLPSHASPTARAHGHIQAAHAGSPPVLYRERAVSRYDEGLPRRIFSAIRADCLPRDGRRPRVCGCHDLVVQCRVASGLRVNRHVYEL